MKLDNFFRVKDEVWEKWCEHHGISCLNVPRKICQDQNGYLITASTVQLDWPIWNWFWDEVEETTDI